MDWKRVRRLAGGTMVLTMLTGCWFNESTHRDVVHLSSEVKVPEIYGDNMVLQRQKPIVFIGEAIPGEAVNIRLGKGKAMTVVADADGQWRAEFPAMEAGGPFELAIVGKDGKGYHFENVMVGEVWICSGQSNMSCPVWSNGRFWRSANGDLEVKAANYPDIRLFNCRQKTSPLVPQNDIEGTGWKVCSPDSVGSFSAVGYYFGRQLYKDMKIPIGLIGSNWGGTRIEAWISEGAFRKIDFQRELIKIDNARAQGDPNKEAVQNDNFKKWEKRFYEFGAAESKKAADWMKPDFNDQNWQNATVPTGSPLEDSIDGVVWYRRVVDIPENWAGKSLSLQLGVIDDCDETWFNGVKVGATGSEVSDYWSVFRKYKVPGNLVKAGKAVIAVRLIDMFASGGFYSKPADMRLVLNNKEFLPLAGTWKFNLEFAADLRKIGLRPDVDSKRKQDFPATLYNAMISPWTVYPVRGAIWYQGESNAGDPANYLILHKLLIEDWRTQWQDPNFAFLFVQLSAFDRHTPQKRLPEDAWKSEPAGSDRGYSRLREVQTATLAVPKTGMAVSIDVGDQSDIHPQKKQEVGYRLAKEAERICYDGKDISHGPMFREMKIEGNRIRLRFDGLGSGWKVNGREIGGFVIAGSDGKFVHAAASLEGDDVIVWSPEVKEPVAVRYAWAPYPGDANLFNREDFPTCPFRTDKPDYVK